METIITNKYPIRYVAFDNPKVWVENESKRNSGGNEWAVYYEPVQNFDYPHIKDGIYISISSFRGVSCIVECHLTLPDKQRKQFNQTTICENIEEARNLTLEWLSMAQSKMNSVIMIKASKDTSNYLTC